MAMRDWDAIIGMKSHRLTVTGHLKRGRRKFLSVICDCGNKKEVEAYAIVGTKKQVSCGCAQREMYLTMGDRFRKHGRRKSCKTYRAHQSMLWRNNPRNKQDYKYYQHLGVCDRWKGPDGFTNFLDDMGECALGMTLDRIDNSKGYSPKNCRWADRKTQSRNSRTPLKINWNGHERLAMDVTKELGLRHQSVLAACYRNRTTAEIEIRRLASLKGTKLREHT